MVKPMKSPYEKPYKKYDPEAFKRRMQRQRNMSASGITTDESKDRQGNSRLSSTRRG